MAALRSDVPVDELIISEIREKYTYVYNFKDYRYRNKNLRDKAWREIGVFVGMEAKDVSARWKTLRDKYVREKKKPRSGSGAAEKTGNRLQSLLGFLDDVVCARQSTSSLPDSINSFADVEEEVVLDAEASNCRSSVAPSPLSSAPLNITPAPSPTLQHSSTINSSLPFLTPTSAPICIPIEPTTPQTSVEPAQSPTLVHSSQRNSMKGRRKEDDLLAALIKNQPREMDECDLYCASLAARLKKMPAHDMHAMRFKIEQLLIDYSNENK